MSRTDKTRPGWVKAFFDAPIHHDHRNGECVEETFDDAQFWATRRPRYSWPRPPTCTRYFGGRYSHIARHIYGDHVPGWYVHHTWVDPERRRARDGLRDMLKEYNANGELEDDDFPNYQHHHRASWYWD